MQITQSFQVKTYGWQELGLLYSPELKPESAAKRLKRWVLHNHLLTHELTRMGWNRNKRVMTPGEIELIVRYLGEP